MQGEGRAQAGLHIMAADRHKNTSKGACSQVQSGT